MKRAPLLLLLPVGLAAAGCGGGGTAPRSPAARTSAVPPAVRRYLRVEPARRAVEVTLVAGAGSRNNGFNFDGYGRGELSVRVPRGWRVTVHCRNGGDRYSSCVVVSGPGAAGPAFPGATTPAPVSGLAPGEAASFSFVASRAGSYRFASLVPGDERARMWDVLEVVPGGRPTLSVRPGP